jgi:hypothetical protein
LDLEIDKAGELDDDKILKPGACTCNSPPGESIARPGRDRIVEVEVFNLHI